MRFLVVIKANKKSEAGVMPSEQLVMEMGKFNADLIKADVLLAAEGLYPSSKGARVDYAKGKLSVTDGPFPETKELIAGYWIWQCESLEAAIAWAKRIPNPDDEEGQIEIRPIFEVEDFSTNYSPKVREQEERLRKKVSAKA